MSRYLMTLWEGGGNVAPMLSVGRALAARGHEIRVLADPVLEPEIETAGLEFFPWATAPARSTRDLADDVVRDWEARGPGAFKRALDRLICGPAAAFARDTLDELDRRPVDAVLADVMLLGTQIAAEAREVPLGVICHTINILPIAGVPPFGLGLSRARGPAGRLRDAVLARVSTRLWNSGLGPLNEARRALGLPALASPFEQFRAADRFLVLTSRAFDFVPGAPPANVRWVGPRLDDPAWTDDWTPPSGDDPLVLVALSTTFQDQLAPLRRIVAALAELPVRGLVTLGHAIDPRDLDAPPNATVVASAPHREVLHHAAAVVTHGGHGTVIKALAAGVPVVCLPMGRDQFEVGARLVACGAGLRLRAGASSRAVADAVRRLLDQPAFGEESARMAAAIAQERETDLAVAECEALGCAPQTVAC